MLRFCPTPDKKGYVTEREADLAIARCQRFTLGRLRKYECVCGELHITRLDERVASELGLPGIIEGDHADSMTAIACEYCHESFTPKTQDQKYCCQEHARTAKRRRHRANRSRKSTMAIEWPPKSKPSMVGGHVES